MGRLQHYSRLRNTRVGRCTLQRDKTNQPHRSCRNRHRHYILPRANRLVELLRRRTLHLAQEPQVRLGPQRRTGALLDFKIVEARDKVHLINDGAELGTRRALRLGKNELASVNASIEMIRIDSRRRSRRRTHARQDVAHGRFASGVKGRKGGEGGGRTFPFATRTIDRGAEPSFITAGAMPSPPLTTRRGILETAPFGTPPAALPASGASAVRSTSEVVVAVGTSSGAGTLTAEDRLWSSLIASASGWETSAGAARVPVATTSIRTPSTTARESRAVAIAADVAAHRAALSYGVPTWSVLVARKWQEPVECRSIIIS